LECWLSLYRSGVNGTLELTHKADPGSSERHHGARKFKSPARDSRFLSYDWLNRRFVQVLRYLPSE